MLGMFEGRKESQKIQRGRNPVKERGGEAQNGGREAGAKLYRAWWPQ